MPAGEVFGFAANVPGGVSSVSMVHGLNTTSVHVETYEVASGLTVTPEVDRLDANTVALSFIRVPTVGQYRVVITSVA